MEVKVVLCHTIGDQMTVETHFNVPCGCCGRKTICTYTQRHTCIRVVSSISRLHSPFFAQFRLSLAVFSDSFHKTYAWLFNVAPLQTLVAWHEPCPGTWMLLKGAMSVYHHFPMPLGQSWKNMVDLADPALLAWCRVPCGKITKLI